LITDHGLLTTGSSRNVAKIEPVPLPHVLSLVPRQKNLACQPLRLFELRLG
jgi:hypothetical protein